MDIIWSQIQNLLTQQYVKNLNANSENLVFSSQEKLSYLN